MTAPMRALIVDDARLARQELRTLLSAIADVELVGEADDVASARAAIATLQPDVLLLDIQLPSGTGFDVLDALEATPCVVFTTAYDQYAVRAFEANALDYLVFRANRNTLVNLRQVRSIEQSISDGYLLTLKDGSTVDVSRRQARELRERLAL